MTGQLLDDYESTLDELKLHLDTLVGQLRCEREAIVDYNLESITKIYKEKNDTLNKIQKLESYKKELSHGLKKEYQIAGTFSSDALVNQIKDVKRAAGLKNRLSCLKSLAQAVCEFNDSQRQYVMHAINDVRTQLSLISQMTGKVSQGYNKDGVVEKQKGASVLNQSV